MQPIYKENMMCGYTEYRHVIAFPHRYNRSHCFALENMTALPECEQIFKKLFNDLLCVKRVKEQFIKRKNKTNDLKCNCPDVCDSFKFDTFYSLASWPGDGPFLDQAYKTIVLDKVIPYFQSKGNSSHQDLSVANKMIKYLSDSSNKKEIMSNFLRLTVYIKDLAVETTEDLVGYSGVDLLSDIGRYCYIIQRICFTFYL